MTAPDLKPCPFCGGKVGIERSETACAIVCIAPSKCLKSGLLIGFSPDEETEAIKAWNTRAPLADPAAIRAAAAVVEREIEQAKQLMPMVVPILRGVHRNILALAKGAAE